MTTSSQAYFTRIHQAISNAMGPAIQEFLRDDNVIEIMLNSDGWVWVERLDMGMAKTSHKMPRDSAETVIRLVASQSGVICNEANPSLSAILPISEERFQAFVPPVVDAPTFSIRKRAIRVFSLDDYVSNGILSLKQKDFIVESVRSRKNILVVGGTGTGKTTLANAILLEMSQTGDRIITIEDTPELQCTAENKAQLYTKNEIGFTMQKAVKETLRMRPDRIVVGEVRDGSALDLLKAWNTGHSGGVATIHANGARLGIRRLESLVGEASMNPQRDLIADAINVVISIKRTAQGRVVDEILEVSLDDGTSYVFRDIF